MELGKLFVFITRRNHTAFISKIHLVMVGPDTCTDRYRYMKAVPYGCAMNTNSVPNSAMNMPYFSLFSARCDFSLLRAGTVCALKNKVCNK